MISKQNKTEQKLSFESNSKKVTQGLPNPKIKEESFSNKTKHLKAKQSKTNKKLK